MHRVAAVFGGWMVVGILFAVQTHAFRQRIGDPISFGQALAATMAFALIWAVLSLIVLWLADRLPITGRGKGLRLLEHLALSLAFSAAYFLGERVLASAGSPAVQSLLARKPVLVISFQSLVLNLQSAFLLYWALVAIGTAFAAHRRARERESEAARLQARLAQAELQVLKMQLHPHFLFNTLQAIAQLLHEDPDAAERMIGNLSGLLRLALEQSSIQEIPLDEELKMLERYLEIQRTRFEDRLAVSLEVDPGARDGLVPGFLLQPLVENAIRHGLAPRSLGGAIGITATRRDGDLRLEVSDDGIGLEEAAVRARSRTGFGLSNLRARLSQLYGERWRLDLQGRPGGGTVASVTIPYVPGRRGAGEQRSLA